MLSTYFSGDLLQGFADCLFSLVALPFWAEYRSSFLARLSAPLLFFVRSDLSACENTPGRESESMGARHRDNLALEGALHHIPQALVDNEGCQGVISRVLVGL